ncbi:ankyrin-3-like [Corticium candelabrum]|uniref:ankyrin-3-like n=1 Tax=Corticium candelabrum TaxID=121492 RepID=UPI002E264C3B|nr:ankyrin-3-like [Corticium candelabrum]
MFNPDFRQANLEGETALHVTGNVEVFDYIVGIGLNVEARNKYGYTPFLRACRYGRLSVVQRLIRSKTDRNKAIGFQNMNIDKQGSNNVFESGRQFGHVEEQLVAKLSLVSSSEIPENGSTALHLICSEYGLKNDHLSIVKLLTSLRVDVSAKNNLFFEL